MSSNSLPNWLKITFWVILPLFFIRLGIGIARPFVNGSSRDLVQIAVSTPSATQTDRPVPTNTRAIPTRTSTPRPTIVSQSKILYEEGFEDGGPSNWTTYYGTWTIEEESSNHYWVGTGPNDYPQAWIDSSFDWGNYAFETRIRINQGGVFVCLRADHGSSFYNVFVNSNDSSLGFAEYLNGTYLTFGQGTISIQRNKWYTMRFEVEDDSLRFYIDNKLVLSARRDSISSGGIGYYMGGGDEIHFDNIRVWSLD